MIINCEINLILTWSANCTKLYVPVVTQDNAKIFQQLKLDFKRTINCNKYQSRVTVQERN